jgi:hypothetical protein
MRDEYFHVTSYDTWWQIKTGELPPGLVPGETTGIGSQVEGHGPHDGVYFFDSLERTIRYLQQSQSGGEKLTILAISKKEVRARSERIERDPELDHAFIAYPKRGIYPRSLLREVTTGRFG